MIDLNKLLTDVDRLDSQLFKELDSMLYQLYGLLLTFMTDDLSPQQRKIWINLAEIYPKTLSGMELADNIGSSKISKTIYQALKTLEQKNLILIDRKHPKNMVIQANKDHTMTKIIIELALQYAEQK